MRLLEPGYIGNLKLKNRVIMPAMGIRGTVEKDGEWGTAPSPITRRGPPVVSA